MKIQKIAAKLCFCVILQMSLILNKETELVCALHTWNKSKMGSNVARQSLNSEKLYRFTAQLGWYSFV